MDDTLLTSNDLVAVLRADIADLKTHHSKQTKRYLIMEGSKAVLLLTTLTVCAALALIQLWAMMGPSL